MFLKLRKALFYIFSMTSHYCLKIANSKILTIYITELLKIHVLSLNYCIHMDGYNYIANYLINQFNTTNTIINNIYGDVYVYIFKYGLLLDYSVPTKVCIKTFIVNRHFSRMSSFPVQDELIFLAYM